MTTQQYHVPIDHCRFKMIPEVMKISKRITSNTPYLSFLSYTRGYNDGFGFDLVSNKDWAKKFYKEYLFSPQYSKNRIKTGVNYWKNNKSDAVTVLREDLLDNFNIDARIEFVYKDDINQCYHTYSFVSDPKNAKKAYRFYDIHRNKLFKFIAYFNKEAAHLMAESNKPENLTQIPGYSIDDIDDPIRDYMREILEENQETELSSREFETMLLYAYGLKTAQIAEVFSKSPKAVETQLLGIRRKTGCQDRKSLQLYVRKNGWNGLERFFFKSKGVPTLSKSIH